NRGRTAVEELLVLAAFGVLALFALAPLRMIFLVRGLREEQRNNFLALQEDLRRLRAQVGGAAKASDAPAERAAERPAAAAPVVEPIKPEAPLAPERRPAFEPQPLFGRKESEPEPI